MAETDNEPNAVASLIVAAALFAGGYFGYTILFPSDRAQVRSCIEGMMEASRGSGMYGEFNRKLAAVNAADTVVIEDEQRRPIGRDVLLTLHYNADDHRGTVMCAG